MGDVQLAQESSDTAPLGPSTAQCAGGHDGVVSFNFNYIMHCELIEQGTGVNAKMYLAILHTWEQPWQCPSARIIALVYLTGET